MMLYHSKLLLFIIILLFGERSAPCSCDGGVRIHKIFVDRGMVDEVYQKNIKTIRSSVKQYKKRIPCDLKIKVWEYAEMRALVKQYDPELAEALDRINRKSFAALVADIGRAVILYDQGGWYQDASYEFGDEDHFCDIYKLYMKFDAVFRKILPPQARSKNRSAFSGGGISNVENTTFLSTFDRVCGVAPKPFCRGTTSGPCEFDQFIKRCARADGSCVGIWQQSKEYTNPHHDCSFLLCGEIVPSVKAESSCVTIFQKPDTSFGEHHQNRLVNNNIAVRKPKSPILAAALNLMRKRLFKAIEDFDLRSRYRGDVPGECASILHDIGTGAFSDAVLAFAGHPRSYRYQGIELYRIRGNFDSFPRPDSNSLSSAATPKAYAADDMNRNHTVVFSTWHGSARTRSIYAQYNAPATANLSTSGHWHNINNREPLFLPPAVGSVKIGTL